ncbi:MAG TPA: hypothetical protein VE690_19395 [Rhodopila sp.]|nr:hypothetical protein [Rhodopila sp.]
MLLTFLRWWTAQLADLASNATKWSVSGLAGGVVVSYPDDGEPAASIRRRGRSIPVSLAAAARLSRYRRVILRAPANIVLVRRHAIPAMPARDAAHLLRHELSRLSPFAAEELFWQWAIIPDRSDRSGMEVTLTMVPRVAIRPALARLERAGLSVDFIEAGSSGSPQWLPVRTAQQRRARLLARALTCANLCLALAAAGIPSVRQALALRRVEIELAALQPAVEEAQALRRTLWAADA